MSILRSAARVLVAVIAIVGAAVVAIRQPTFAARDRLTAHADPNTLRRDVTTLTAMPRCAGDAEALDRAAAHIARRFAQSGARVGEQTYVARRRVYRTSSRNSTAAERRSSSARTMTRSACRVRCRARTTTPAASPG